MLVRSLPLVLALLAPPTVDPEAAMRTMNEGVALAHRNDWSGAEAALRRASTLDPTLGHAWLNLGHVYRKTERLEEAAQAFRSGLDVSKEGPLRVELQAQLGRTRLEQARAPGASHADRMAKAGEAVESLREATRAEPHRVRALRQLARAYEQLDQPEQADAAYRRAIAADPSCSPAFVGLADLYVAHGFHELAIVVLHEDIKRNPEQADGWNGLGRALASAGRPADAIEAFDRALVIDPDVPEAYFALGMAYAELRRREEAIAALSRFLERVGPDTDPMRLRQANDTVARMQDTF